MEATAIRQMIRQEIQEQVQEKRKGNAEAATSAKDSKTVGGPDDDFG